MGTKVSISVTELSNIRHVALTETTVAELVDDFARSLTAARKSPKTIHGYTDTARRFAAFLTERQMPTTVKAVEKAHVEAWVIDQVERHAPATAAGRYRYLQQFWRWVVEEGEADVSPMARMSPPKLPERPVPVFDTAELRALLKVTSGTDFTDRRDHAVIRLFMATGVRLGEMAGLRVDSLAREEQAVLVIGKGDRGRWVPYTDKAAVALDRYLRMRRRHPQAHLSALWIGQRGALSASGITQLLRRRAATAGVADVHPHRFRHDTAHRALAAGATESDAMEVFGWRSPEMLRRYGASARSERARANFRRLDLEGDL
jgi:site-specific recombinase XerD